MTAHLQVKCHYEGMSLPRRAHPNDVGMDVTAMAVEARQANVFFFDTGISFHISPGYYVEVVPRSSIAKTDFVMANSVGIIDPDYRGRLWIPLRYVGSGDSTQAANSLLNTRIAQLLVRRFEPCTLEQVSELPETERAGGGFGSTGRSP